MADTAEEEAEYRQRTKRGDYRWISNHMSLVRDSAGRALYRDGNIRDITERRQADDALRRAHDTLEQRVRERTAELERRTVQLRSMALELTQAESRERKRLAAVLHDRLQQLLVGAKLGVELAQKSAADDILKDSIGNVAGLLDESIKVSRSLTVEISPPILHEGGLVPAARWLSR